jgi:hypothetical protein
MENLAEMQIVLGDRARGDALRKEAAAIRKSSVERPQTN